MNQQKNNFKNNRQTQLQSYQHAIRLFWKQLYTTGGKTIYSLQQFGPNKPEWINIEHIFPMAWVVNELKCKDRRDCRYRKKFNFIESDMHNMYAARKDVNQTRGAMPFGIIKGEKHHFKGCDFEVDFRSRRVEPRPEARGRIARAMLYMADEYNLDIYRKQRQMLEKWNKQYPPDKEEKRHNAAVAKIQGKPNPYIK